MRRSCPHCGQEQMIADEEIQAPWVFTRCHRCENLSILRKEGAPAPVAPKRAVTPAPAPAPKSERQVVAAPLRQAAPAMSASATWTPSAGAREIRPEAVLGAFATAARERPENFRPPIFASSERVPQEDEKEWELPSYFSPYAADSEKVVFKMPPTTPAFLRRIKSEPLQESALEPMAEAIRRDANPSIESAEPIEQELPELPELDLDSVLDDELDTSYDLRSDDPAAAASSSPAPLRSSSPSGSSKPPPASGGSSTKRRQKLLGAGALLLGIGFGLLVLKPRPRAPEPEPEPISALAPKPAAFVPVRPAPIVPPPPAPAEIAQAPAARTPSGFWIVTVAGAKTSLRSGPGKEFKVLGEVEPGSRWKVRKWEGEWFNVEPEDLGPGTLGIGWIRNDLVKPVGNGGPS